jgi:hypothetical protein
MVKTVLVKVRIAKQKFTMAFASPKFGLHKDSHRCSSCVYFRKMPRNAKATLLKLLNIISTHRNRREFKKGFTVQ